MHVLTERCDLETGRSLNIAPPGWQKTFGALRDAFNHQHVRSHPDDPARARAHQPGHRAYLEAAKLRAGLEHETCGSVSSSRPRRTRPCGGSSSGSTGK